MQRRQVLRFAALAPPLLASVVRKAVSAAAAAPATYDLGDFDPALPGFVAGLIAPTGRPGPGPLRSLIAEPKGTTLRFRDLAVSLPNGEIGRAAALPLVAEMLRRRANVRLVPESDTTYAALDDAVTEFRTRGIAPRVIEQDGTIAPLPEQPIPTPSPFKPITEAQPLPSHAGGPNRALFDLLRVGPPLADPVWLRANTEGGLLLVQPFTYRVLVWYPRTNALRTTALGDAAEADRLIRDNPLGPTLASITTLLATTSRNMSVALVFTTARGVTTVSWGGWRSVPTASVMKLAILAAYQEACANGFPRTAATDALAEAMIVQSSNGAANQLIDLLTPGRVNGTLVRLGLGDTHLGQHFEAPGWGDPRDNTTVARDCAHLLNALVAGDLPGDGTRVREWLSRSEAPGSVRRAADKATVYEKRGWYAGVENEVARVQLAPDRAVTVVALQPDVRDIRGTQALFTDLTAQATAALRDETVW